MIKVKFGWLAKVLNRSMIKVLNKSTSKDDEHKDRQGDFANLPTLVLWMIKDRLDFPSNRCFACVCKSWHEATLSYSKDVSLCKESPPWLMIKDLKRHGRCKFISTSTGKRYSIFNCDLYCTETLFTKQGWFLLGTKMRTNIIKYKKSCGLCFKNDNTGPSRPLLLLNPFTNKKIELPDEFSWLVKDCRGAFTLVDGKPDLVAFAGLQYGNYMLRRCIKLWTIRVTDLNSSWTEHTYIIPRSWFFFRPRYVVIFGQNIYIVCKTTKLLVFNLSSCKWVSGRHFFSLGNVYMDTEKGVLWKVRRFSTPAVAAGLRLNDNCRDWEKLKFEELGGSKCWFVTARSCYDYDNSYVVSKDISDAIVKDLVKKRYLMKGNIPCHDEDDPNTITKIIEYTIVWDKRNVEWVDMPSN